MHSVRYSGRLRDWGVCLGGGVSAQILGGDVYPGAMSAQGGLSAHVVHLPHPVDRMTDVCENITFP